MSNAAQPDGRVHSPNPTVGPTNAKKIFDKVGMPPLSVHESAFVLAGAGFTNMRLLHTQKRK